MKEFVNGSELIARAALHAECNFFAGYPITPATSILLHLMRELPKVRGTAIQAEDEIASLGFCIGAAMSGARVMTATSGPGISLYSENIGLAIMGEVPVVIINCQRMGPATGAATTTSQGDVQFMRWGTSGGYPVIVLAPASVSDCYYVTMKAFDLAERFRTPVFVAVDKELVLTQTAIDALTLRTATVRERVTHPLNEIFVPYQTSELSEVPLMSHFGSPHIVRFTTSSHDEQGYLTKDPQQIGNLNQHLIEKIEAHLDQISMTILDEQPAADTLLIGYGITTGSILEARKYARQCGIKISSLILQSLWPVPEEQIQHACMNKKRVVVAELNNGQYSREIERIIDHTVKIIRVNRVDGELIPPEQILREGEIILR